MEKELINLRTDDIPLLYAIIRQLKVGEIINDHIQVHGNWEGELPGGVLELWLCYILSNCDHRLCRVEEWSEQRLELLKAMSGSKDLTSYDFADDKLGTLLDYFSNQATWSAIETDINKQVLGVYRFEEIEDLATFRLDAAPMQSHGQVKENGLLQYGYSKHHSKLAQFKIKLCTLDNQLNYFATPICHLTVNGKTADDGLYMPMIAQTKQVLSKISAYARGNLFVGDSKFGSISNRAYVVKNEDYYLMPLSLIQLPQTELEKIIKASEKESYIQVFREKKKGKRESILVAEGFEIKEQLHHSLEQHPYDWEERRLLVRSLAYAHSQEQALERRLKYAEESLSQLSVRKQGKAVLKTKVEHEQAIYKILKTNKVDDFIVVKVKETQTSKVIRAYGNRAERIEKKSHFEIQYQRQEQIIKEHKRFLGWQVYATNAPEKLLSFEKCVWKYRYQSNIESRFDDLRNKMAPLLPIYLQKDNRIEGLVNILLLALKICSTLEYKIAKTLQENDEELNNIYEGNPKRGTNRPSAKRILRAFEGISISLIFIDKQFQFALMTKLEPVQLKILELLDLNVELYTNLSAKIEMFFSENVITET